MLPEDGRRPKHVGAFKYFSVCFSIQKILVHLLVFLGKLRLSTIKPCDAETVVLGIVPNVLLLGVLIYAASTSTLPINGHSNLVRKR
jgi:hypothetical protein